MFFGTSVLRYRLIEGRNFMPSKLIEKNKINDIFYGFNYDKMFKAIFVGFNEDRTHLLCELLSECLDIKIDKIIKFIPV